MIYHIAPPPPLAGLVDMLWVYEGYAPPHPRERLLPDGAVELVINLDEAPMRVYEGAQDAEGALFRDALVCGPHSRCFVIDTARPTTVAGVHFRPGGAPALLRAPADALHNAHLPLVDLWGDGAAALSERLRDAASPRQRLDLLARVLLERLPRFPEQRPAIAQAIQAFERQPQAGAVAQVSAAVGLSERQLARLFREAVGLTPKQFCRVRRFQQLLRRIERGRAVAWAETAIDCGYYDQSHLIRDFQLFAGLNPSSYLLGRGDHPNHLPLST
ncbi:MAG TPA: helix-turn-helix domain-containing protein [Roseiflexaceae bacterium]|nr:helix-turn-helix domain-containing protein [Roseiflexaceae bacterium]